MQITIQDGPDSVLVQVQGEVDLESAPDFWQELEPQFDRGRAVHIGLQGVGYMDSTGVAVLVRALKKAQQHSTPLVLRSPSERVQAVLDLARLSGLFTIEDGS